jgi:hypothetical protein
MKEQIKEICADCKKLSHLVVCGAFSNWGLCLECNNARKIKGLPKQIAELKRVKALPKPTTKQGEAIRKRHIQDLENNIKEVGVLE